MHLKGLCLIVLLVCCTIALRAQDSSLVSLPSGYLDKVSSRVQALEQKLDTKTDKALLQLQKQEERIRGKLSRLDSTKAKQVFSDAEVKYSELKQKLHNPSSLSQYIPYLDTLKTSLKFLEQGKEKLSYIKDVEEKLKETTAKIKGLEASLQKSEQLKAFIKERRQYLKQSLANLPFTKELKKLNKQAYYYSAQLNEYKQALKEPKKLERKAIELLSKTKPFQDFMRKNSQLASLFRLPGNDDPASASAALQGLQTRAQVNQMIQDRIGTGADAQAVLRDNIRGAQSQLSELKAKAAQYTNGSFGNGGDIEQPDFTPNTQKTRSFLKRLEYGGNVQSQRERLMFPVTSDVALSLGYKLNDKSIIGVGGSYKLGLGRGWNSITLSHQGVGIRSFIDYNLKGSIYISGGYEQNYRSEIRAVEQLRNYSAWQSSGLIGLSKKYSISKKLNGNVQLLWDFLSYQQVPKTQAVLFRVGYALK